MKKHLKKITAGVIIAVLLAFLYCWGGNAPDVHNENVEIEKKAETETVMPESPAEPEAKPEKQVVEAPEAVEKNVIESAEATEKDEPAYVSEPIVAEPQETVVPDGELTCTLSVRCDTILENIEWISEEKISLVPQDGVIFAETTVTFYEGESVFNLLMREMKRNKIHMEFVNTPVYNSAYIEGIGNLYEFDCGELSGWMYKVNDVFPKYGCSRYLLKDGDKVEWVYTCNLGQDVGGNESQQRNGRGNE